MLSLVRDADLDLAIQNELQLLERLEVERIAHQHLQRAVFFGERNDRVFAGDRLGHEFHDRRRNRHVVQIEELVAVQVGHRLHDLLAGGVALLDEDFVDLAAIVLGEGLGLGKLLLADDPPLDEKIAQVFFCHRRTALDVCSGSRESELVLSHSEGPNATASPCAREATPIRRRARRPLAAARQNALEKR